MQRIDRQALRDYEEDQRKRGNLGPNEFLDESGKLQLRDPRFGPSGDPAVNCQCGYPFDKDGKCPKCGLVPEWKR